MLNIRIILLICIFGFVLSCRKSDEQILKSDALLTWTGDYAVDGCGFFIKINNHEYKPENETDINDDFKVDSMAVLIEYQSLDKKLNVTCGFSLVEPTDAIKIISIKKK